jgi:hypothetical protein
MSYGIEVKNASGRTVFVTSESYPNYYNPTAPVTVAGYGVSLPFTRGSSNILLARPPDNQSGAVYGDIWGPDNKITFGADAWFGASNGIKHLSVSRQDLITPVASGSSIINMNTWNLGSGSTPGFNQNGLTVENERINATDPWGMGNIVWETRCSGDGNNDGGWNTDWFNIDRNSLYRFSVWIKRASPTSGGRFYLGMYANGEGTRRTDNNEIQTNAYWDCRLASALTENQWYLVVGHCYPSNTSFTGRHPDSGFYTTAGRIGNIDGCNIGSGDLKWGTNSTQGIHRTYHFYSGDNTTRLQFFQPRVDKVDGTEPSINTLLRTDPKSYGIEVFKADGSLLYTSNTSYSFNILSYSIMIGGQTQVFTCPSSVDFNNVYITPMSFPAILITYKYSPSDLYPIAPDFSSFIGGLAYFDNATKTITVKTGGIFGGANAIHATNNFTGTYSSSNRRDYFIIEVKS